MTGPNSRRTRRPLRAGSMLGRACLRAAIGLTAAVVAASAACGRDALAPERQQRTEVPLSGRQFSSLSPSKLVLTDREEELVRALEAMYPGSGAPPFRALLTDPRVGKLSVPRNRRADSLLVLIYAARMTRLQSKFSSELLAAARLDYPVSVLVGTSIPDSGADAVIWRRTRELPHDVILLRAGASVQNLGAAVKALSAIRSKNGDLPAKDQRVVVHGRRLPSSWILHRWDREIQTQLEAASDTPKLSIAGIGTEHGFVLHLKPTQGAP